MHLISRCRGGLFREWFTLSPSLFLFSFSLVHFLIPYLAVQFLSPSPTHLHYLTQSVSFSLLHTARWIVFGKMTSPVYYQGKSPPSDSFTLLEIISLKCLQHAKRYFHIRCCDSFPPPLPPKLDLSNCDSLSNFLHFTKSSDNAPDCVANRLKLRRYYRGKAKASMACRSVCNECWCWTKKANDSTNSSVQYSYL